MVNVSIIVVSYNTRKLSIDCVKSVINEGSSLIKEIIIVDNGSTDGSIVALQKLHATKKKGKHQEKIKFIINKRNLGFAKANNQGIEKSSGKYVLLLNSDCRVMPGSIGRLVNFADKTDNVGAVVPWLMNSDGTRQGSVFRFPTLKRAVAQYWLGHGGILDKYFPEGNNPVQVEAAVMAAFLITPKAIQKVGTLDERYFMFFEDIDYCARLKKANLKIYYLPDAKVFHIHGASGKYLTDSGNQWKRLIPSSKIYHGALGHYLYNFILWSGQKWHKYSIKKT